MSGHHSSTPWFWARGRTRSNGNPSMTHDDPGSSCRHSSRSPRNSRPVSHAAAPSFRTSPSSLSPASVSIGRFGLTLVQLDPLSSSSPTRVSIGRACLVSRCIVPSGTAHLFFSHTARVLAGLVSRCIRGGRSLRHPAWGSIGWLLPPVSRLFTSRGFTCLGQYWPRDRFPRCAPISVLRVALPVN